MIIEQSNEIPISINPFPSFKIYEEEDWTLFAGRDTEISDIGFQVLSEHIFLVYGDSGVGKTSLIRAGLNKWMENRGVVLCYRDCPKNDTWKNIFDNFNKVVTQQKPYYQVICFDSFERVLDQTDFDNQKCKNNFKEFADLIRQTPDISIVLVLRSEWLVHLEWYERLLPNQLKARYRIDPLTKKVAQEVIKKVTEFNIHPFDDKVAQWVLKKITNEGNESVDLTIMQVVCHWIWEKANTDNLGKDDLTEDWLNRLNIEDILKCEYEKKLEDFFTDNEKEKSNFRQWLWKAITIDKNGSIAPKVIERDFTPSFQAAINNLESSHILRRVEVQTKNEAVPELYEIAHYLWLKVIEASHQESDTKAIFDGEMITGNISTDKLDRRVNFIKETIHAKAEANVEETLQRIHNEHWNDRNEVLHKRQAQAHIGLMVLEGKPLKLTQFPKETYHYLEEVRVRDVKDLRAYLLWERDGSGFDYKPEQEKSKKFFHHTCDLLKQRMRSQDVKILHSGESYEELTGYIRNIMTDNLKTKEGWEKLNDLRLKIVERKATWLEEDRRWCGRPVSNEENWADAVKYTQRFYYAVYQLINEDNVTSDTSRKNIEPVVNLYPLYQDIKDKDEQGEKSKNDMAIALLKKAINSEDKWALINCFEAAILMYYASPEIVEKAELDKVFD